MAFKDLQEGFELPSVSKEITLDRMKIFSAWSGKSMHTDKEVAKIFGFPKVVGQALMPYTYLIEVLVGFFGEDWLRGGKMDVAFIKPFFEGDTISTRVIVLSRQNEGAAVRVNLEVSCENQDGEKTTVGTASVLVTNVVERTQL